MNIVQAIEIEPIGIFKNYFQAEIFNSKVGGTLKLYPIRTTLPPHRFREIFFSEQEAGYYLEQCCGKGNVTLNIKKSLFNGIACVSGSFHERDELLKVFSKRESGDVSWTRPYHKASMLLSIDEICKYASHPSRVIYVRDFGLVDERNLLQFKKVVNLNSRIGNDY